MSSSTQFPEPGALFSGSMTPSASPYPPIPHSNSYPGCSSNLGLPDGFYAGGSGFQTPQPDVSREGFKIEHARVEEENFGPDHYKNKRLSYGGHAYQMSSPFDFSQSEDAPPPPQPVQMMQPMYSAPPPDHYDSVQVRMEGHQGHQANFSYRQQIATPPVHYPPQQHTRPPMVRPMVRPPAPVRDSRELAGWLGKRGDNFSSSWLNRWCRIEGNKLSYSQTQNGPEEGFIVLDGFTQVRGLNDPMATPEARILKSKKPFGFEIFAGRGAKAFYFDAGTAEKQAIWLQQMNRITSDAHHMAQMGPYGHRR